MNRKYLLLTLCFFPCSLFAQQNWNLKACIEYGLANNRSNTIYANEKAAADAKAKEALAAYLPSVSLNGSLDNNLKVQETVIPAGLFGPTDTRVAFTKKYATNATAQLDQTLFDQSLLTGLKANKFSKQQAELNQYQNQETIIYNVSTAYYQILVYREQLNLLLANKETYSKQMAVYTLQVQKGTVLQKELDKVTVDYNNSVSNIRVAESNIVLSENQLKYEMGFPMSGTVKVDSIAARDMQLPSVASAALKNSFSADNRTDYKLSVVNAKLDEIDEKRIKAGIYPKLTAYAKYGAVGFGDNISPAFSTLSPFSAVGLKLNIPVFDFFKRNAQYNQARYKRLNAQETLKQDEGKYQMEFENANTKMLKEQSNIENNERNIQLAQSVFKTTDLQFQKGTTDLTDWLNAQNSLKEAQNNYLTSLYNYFLARIDLEKAGGTLKTFYNSL